MQESVARRTTGWIFLVTQEARGDRRVGSAVDDNPSMPGGHMNRTRSAPWTHYPRTVVAVAMAALVATACIPVPPKTPTQEPVTQERWLDQGWDPHERQWFHHADQGTATFLIPYDWFLHLERPRLRPFGDPGLMIDPDYIQGFGFIPSSVDDHFNPDGLPVGFVKAVDQLDPITGRRVAPVGLTCAACHTAQLSYRGTAMYVDGGPAIANVTDFTIAVSANGEITVKGKVVAVQMPENMLKYLLK